MYAGPGSPRSAGTMQQQSIQALDLQTLQRARDLRAYPVGDIGNVAGRRGSF